MGRFIILLAVFVIVATGVEAGVNPIEIGSVQWGRDLDGALKRSDETGRPLFVLFQEVPGCGGCQDFGSTVLSNPLIVEAIEDEFIPVLVINNRGGKDREWLERFNEPAWNFQVVRFLDADGRDIIPRKDRVWTTGGIATRMVETLKAATRPVPNYLQALVAEYTGKPFMPGSFSGKTWEWLSPRQRNSLARGLTGDDSVVSFLADYFHQLPEKQISVSDDGTVYAQYARPTDRYSHGILGDAIEAEQLVVIQNGSVYTHDLADHYVYEDIKPRLFDVDHDGQVEFVTIRTHMTKGAGIVIYKIKDNALIEYAWVEEIGRASRWLNIAAIYDLDGDGSVELAWVQTPHIGGVLKVARIQPGRMTPLAEISSFSNHSIGERNLCLSVVTQDNNTTILYVPTQNRQQIAGFQVIDNRIRKADTIFQAVDFAKPLVLQHPFTHVVQGKPCVSKGLMVAP